MDIRQLPIGQVARAHELRWNNTNAQNVWVPFYKGGRDGAEVYKGRLPLEHYRPLLVDRIENVRRADACYGRPGVPRHIATRVGHCASWAWNRKLKRC